MIKTGILYWRSVNFELHNTIASGWERKRVPRNKIGLTNQKRVENCNKNKLSSVFAVSQSVINAIFTNPASSFLEFTVDKHHFKDITK